jgi:LacI family transcriptional regulator
VVGIDNLRHGAFMNPALTTVHLPLHNVGARACMRLIERIDEQRCDTVSEKLATHLVLRNSAAMACDVPRAGSSAA